MRSSGSAPLRDRSGCPTRTKCCLRTSLRTEDGANVTADQIRALGNWDASAQPTEEIQFTPARVIMQDFTGVPCVVDLATMREAVAELGGDAAQINPLAPLNSSSTTRHCGLLRDPRGAGSQCRAGIRTQ